MDRGSFELSVAINRDGRATPLREFGHNGNTYIESRDGQKFTIKFRNNRAHRVLIVPSIDGLSVLEGTPATPQSRGYIVPAYSSVEIKGWRTSLEDINEFVFERKDSGKTYAEGTGNDTANCGVIGVKVFDEKLKTWQQLARIVEEHHHHHHHHDYWPSVPEPIYPKYPWKPYQPYWCSTGGTSGGNESGNAIYGALSGHDQGPMLTNSLKPDMSNTVRCMNSVAAAEFTSDQVLSAPKKSVAAAPSFDMGTGFGSHVKDKVSEETFERGQELETMLIFYASAKSLAEIGIDVEKKVAVNVMPQAFQAGFCKAPTTR
jgi:hypothetical protein